MHNAIGGLQLVRLRLLGHSPPMLLALVLAVLTPVVPQERSLLNALVGKAPVLTPEQRQQGARRAAANAACHRRFMGQDYWPQPAIWKVADTDTSIFLFGTIHVLPYDFDWRTVQLDRIVKEAGSLIVEGGAVPTVQPITPSGLPPVVERLDGEARTLWRGMLAMLSEESGAAFDALPTWKVAQQIDATARRRRAPPLDAGADNQLMIIFKGSNKRVEAIEDSAAVDGTLSAVSEVEQRRVLKAQLQDVARPRPITERMALFHRWARGQSLDANPGRVTQSGMLSNRLLDRRNSAWADTIAGRMKEPGTVLVAVGAGHFEGERSLLAELAERGLQAERVSPVGQPRSRNAWIPVATSWDACSDYLMGNKPIPAGDE